MAVRSRNRPAQAAQAPARLRLSPMWPLGIVALLVGAALWLISARYTLVGWVYGGNLLLDLLQLPARIPTPSGWWWLLMIPAGLLYSLIEISIMPGPPATWKHAPIWLLALLLVSFVHATDVGSTAFGYLAPPANAWALHRWVASDGLWALALWAVFLTYVPERAILWGVGWLRPRRG